MGFIQDIENRLLAAIKKLFDPLLKPLLKLWNLLKGFFTAMIDLIPKSIHLVHTILDEISEWRHFKANVNFKGGVINLKSARDKLENLVSEAIDVWNRLRNRLTQGFKFPLKAGEEAAKALEDVIVAFEDFFGDVGLRAALERIGETLSKVGGKVFEVLALVQAVCEELVKVVDDLQAFVDLTKDFRETVQTGGGLFLQQKNPRKTLKLDGGGSIKIRVGNLHS